AGTKWSARRFPVQVGRSTACNLQLEEPGVWDSHFQISPDPTEGFVIQTQPNALVVLNGKPVQHAALRNGDCIEIGGAKLRFWIAEARQRSVKIREALVWTILLAVSLGQVALIYWVLP
ncbi:MAG: FHA domain-containing protein, partial [Akkermansiaceae bacterium]|nr:FHA domain-containing protein [Verrucomicrobiales bacterium]